MTVAVIRLKAGCKYPEILASGESYGVGKLAACMRRGKRGEGGGGGGGGVLI